MTLLSFTSLIICFSVSLLLNIGCGHSSELLSDSFDQNLEGQPSLNELNRMSPGPDWNALREEQASNLEKIPPPSITPVHQTNEWVESEPANPLDAFIQQIVSVSFGEGTGFGLADLTFWLLGPPYGGGRFVGSTDVVSLGNGGEIVFGFPKYFPIDGEGADFIVFENPFYPRGSNTLFSEPGIVGVSQDGIRFIDFPYELNPPYPGCAGTHVIFANPDLNNINPRDPSVAGGDPFDLRDVGLNYVQFIRIRDSNLNLGGRASIDTRRAGFDLDAIAIVHGAKP